MTAHPATMERLQAYCGDPARAPAGLLELMSAHACAESFGHVLEWSTLRTDALFTTPDVDVSSLPPWEEALQAWHGWEAKRAERRFGREAQ